MAVRLSDCEAVVRAGWMYRCYIIGLDDCLDCEVHVYVYVYI